MLGMLLFLLSLLTRKGRARYRAKKLIQGKTSAPVNVETALICIEGLRAVYDDPKYLKNVHNWRILLYHDPEELLREFDKATDLILEGKDPHRRGGPPESRRSTLRNWLFTPKGEIIEYESYMTALFEKSEHFTRLLHDQYEITGPHIAGYRLEQTYFPICDIMSLAEAFYSE